MGSNNHSLADIIDKPFQENRYTRPSLRNTYYKILVVVTVIFLINYYVFSTQEILIAKMILINYTLILVILAVIAFLFRSEVFKTFFFLLFTRSFFAYALLSGRGSRSQLYERKGRTVHRDTPKIYARGFLLVALTTFIVAFIL